MFEPDKGAGTLSGPGLSLLVTFLSSEAFVNDLCAGGVIGYCAVGVEGAWCSRVVVDSSSLGFVSRSSTVRRSSNWIALSFSLTGAVPCSSLVMVSMTWGA